MKKALFTILAIFFFTSLYSQSLEKLDERNGFKEFKLGDTFSKWQKQLDIDLIFEDGSEGYIYKGACCNKIFNYDIEKILLRFSDNKLVAIYITTERFQKSFEESGEYTNWRPDDFETINASFEYLFGESTSHGTNPITYYWEAKKVLLASHYEFLGTVKGDRQVIIVADLSFLNKEIENGF